MTIKPVNSERYLGKVRIKVKRENLNLVISGEKGTIKS